MRDYDKKVHPVDDHSKPVNVEFMYLTLIHLDLDVRKSIMTVDGWVALKWNDRKLKWTPSDHEFIKEIHFGGVSRSLYTICPKQK